MHKYRHEVKVGNPQGRAFARVGMTDDGRLCAELSYHGQPFPHELLVMIAQPFAELMTEAISERPPPDTATNVINVADDAIRRAQNNSAKGEGSD